MQERLNQSNNTEAKDLKNKVLLMISGLKSEVGPWGRNDAEFSVLDKIIKDLENGIITPEEAEKRAMRLIETKQDYN